MTPTFSSDLSVDELLLFQEAGWEPVSLAAGDCSYYVGSVSSTSRRSQEFGWISTALSKGLALALSRMQGEAAAEGADGVLGVRLNVSREHASYHFSAVGTGVRRADRRGDRRRVPFTCLMSGADTWALLAAGAEPLGVVFGYSARRAPVVFTGPSQVCELPANSEAIYAARETAMGALQAQAVKLGAHGVIDTSISRQDWDSGTLIFHAVGTAIRRPDDDGSGALAPRVGIPVA